MGNSQRKRNENAFRIRTDSVRAGRTLT
jgi:hypothetical protein